VAVVLGVDGGGTKTHAVVADASGETLGSGASGPSNWEDVGLATAGGAIGVAVQDALDQAEVQAADVEASVFGLAGVDWPSDAMRLEQVIDPLGLAGPREVMNDSFLALRAGADRRWGVVVISGTGSVVAGRNPAGDMFRTLGLGRLFGDFGSASDVSEEAAGAVANAYTGRGPSTALSDLLCRHVGAGSVAELLERLSRRLVQGRIEAEADDFAPLVIEAANSGDLIARDILERAGAALGESAVLVARTLGMLDLDVEMVLSGGLITGASRYVTDPFEVAVKRAAPRAMFVHLHSPPVVGAVLMAIEMLEQDGSPEVQARLAEGASRALFGVG
jgi:N-acetylglucosamine kinase-like BadF-type ATPase